jgi:hypothetical protein
MSEEEMQELVRRQALPEWMGHVLSKNCTTSCASGAIAPCGADDGEVVTSREQPLRQQRTLSSSLSGTTATSTAVSDSVEVRCVHKRDAGMAWHAVVPCSATGCATAARTSGACSTWEHAPGVCVSPQREHRAPLQIDSGGTKGGRIPTMRSQEPVSASRDSQQRFQDTPRPSGRMHNTTTASTGRLPGSSPGTGAPPARSASPSTRSQSLGSSCDPDDEIKAIMARAVHGLKAQEAVRFKQYMSRMEARVQQLAESHVASLQSVLQKYQVCTYVPVEAASAPHCSPVLHC